MIDQPARGRSAWQPEIEGKLTTFPAERIEQLFTAPELRRRSLRLRGPIAVIPLPSTDRPEQVITALLLRQIMAVPPLDRSAFRAVSCREQQECRMAHAEIIPVIDLGPYLAGVPGAIERTAEEFHFALTEIGFYIIVNHGVPCEQIHAAFREAACFHALPLEKKLEVKLDKHNVGYLPMRGDTLRTSTVETVTKANINEAFFVARDLPSDHPDVLADRRFRSVNRWPTGLPGLREATVAYCATMEQLARKLVR